MHPPNAPLADTTAASRAAAARSTAAPSSGGAPTPVHRHFAAGWRTLLPSSTPRAYIGELQLQFLKVRFAVLRCAAPCCGAPQYPRDGSGCVCRWPLLYKFELCIKYVYYRLINIYRNIYQYNIIYVVLYNRNIQRKYIFIYRIYAAVLRRRGQHRDRCVQLC